MSDPKPFDAYPSKAAWLADLDHTTCTQDRQGNCYGVHCVFCGESTGGGFVRCRCDGATKAWEDADQRHAADTEKCPTCHRPRFSDRHLAQVTRERDEARTRVTKLETEYADRVADGFGIQQLAAEGNAATLTMAPTTEEARHLVLAMSMACGQMLDDAEAPNYVEFEISPAGHTDHAAYVVHVRRAGGPSPHTLRRDAEARAEKAEARVAELEAADREHTQVVEYLHYAHGIDIGREGDDFREWQEQYGA